MLAAAKKEEEKSEYKVELLDIGANKINVIKALRAAINHHWDLQKLKKLAEEAPAVVLLNASKDEAEKLKKELEAAGAKVKL